MAERIARALDVAVQEMDGAEPVPGGHLVDRPPRLLGDARAAARANAAAKSPVCVRATARPAMLAGTGADRPVAPRNSSIAGGRPARSSPARCGMTRDESARSARAGRRHVWLRSRAPVRPPRCLAGARRARGPVPSRGAPRPRRILDAIERDSIPSTWRAGRLGTWESGLKLRTLSGCLRLSVQSQA